MTSIKFSKYHGCGNDFILINNLSKEYDRIHEEPESIKVLCRRNFGIGSDGLILLEKKAETFRYVMYNSD